MHRVPTQDRAPFPLTISCYLSTLSTRSSNGDSLAQLRHRYYARPTQPAEGTGASQAASTGIRCMARTGLQEVFLASLLNRDR